MQGLEKAGAYFVKEEKEPHERAMKELVVVRQNCLRRWYIARAREQRLALSGSSWIEHIKGLGIDRHLTSFYSPDEARRHAKEHGFLVVCTCRLHTVICPDHMTVRCVGS
jgi:hypothetical protein